MKKFSPRSVLVLITNCYSLFQVRDDWKFRLARTRLPCFEKSRRAALKYNTGNYYGASPTFLRACAADTTAHSIIPNSDFMVRKLLNTVIVKNI
jgi:hypothetical protein